jgi:hypothetical protein
MSEAKNEVWVIHDENGEPVNADAYDADAVEFRPPHAVRYVPEASSQGEAGRWQRAPAELPDSDTDVLVATDGADPEYGIARLEFTDDSEGNGEPYWAFEGGDVEMLNYPNWAPLLLPPPKAEP